MKPQIRARRPLDDRPRRGRRRRGAQHGHFCLRIEPFDEAAIVAHLKAHRVALGKITTRFGAEGNGVSIYLTDPEGNQVELKGPSDGKGPPASS